VRPRTAGPPLRRGAEATSRKTRPRTPRPEEPRVAAGPPGPAFRAIPSPEVTEPICRLPLPTLFRSPEAVHLGDPMRLSVRPGSTIFSPSTLGFSRIDLRVAGAPRKIGALYRVSGPISTRDRSRVLAPRGRRS